ncbi:cation acetate symporter [Syntrophotalea acetylenivorans]|uniref:Cation acetate symporter n=1 Tax=Syntrophotalea acetylenivorans TaxID=1842532 RepID=A0A1L3GR96_9BACT|nr:cation acetate symporter [Syntrophotalea acetylenivorans]APG28435.1 cation acetate symporter [Syntrophotalea acetylenivorans]
MIYTQSPLAIALFVAFVLFVLGLSFYLARRTTSSEGYYAAGGNIHWFVNGIAFAGDYLSAASFLGICGMIATAGYDGFLYSIGYLAGWMVALFLVAEPMKRLGKYTFTDALDSKFNSKGIQLAAAISTLVVSVFYLIPQMVGAGVLVQPLLGLPHYVGVIIVGIVVTLIVATAGMASTTYVQFMKGGLLLICSLILCFGILGRGLSTNPDQGGKKAYHDFQTIQANVAADGSLLLSDAAYAAPADWKSGSLGEAGFVKLSKEGVDTIWQVKQAATGFELEETLFVTTLEDGTKLYNGSPKEEGKFFPVGHIKELKVDGVEVAETGAIGPFSFLKTIGDSTVVLWGKKYVKNDDGSKTLIYYQKPTSGARILRPGLKFKVDNASGTDKFNFISLMLALFCGTAALPHILIRYYTVPSQAAARKSTLVAIASIGFFYMMTLFMGIGAMTNGVINLTDNNMSAPLVALSFGVILFSIISSIAFATVLGTVSGLIVAASGAVAHDLMSNFLGIKMTDSGMVMAGKISAVVVGIVAIYLGIVFEGMNVSFLVGWAFAVAASANLPAILMLLFWKKTTAQGITASILVGLVSALGLILLSPDMWVRYGLLPQDAPITFNSPALVSVPLSFIALVVVSLMTQGSAVAAPAED